MTMATQSRQEIELNSIDHSQSTSVIVSVSTSQLDNESLNVPDYSDNESYPDGGLKAYSVVLGSFLGLTANFGVINSVGAVQTYVSTHQLANTQTSTISWIFSIYLALAFALGIVVGPYFDKKGSLIPLSIGTVLVFCGFIAAGNCQTVWQFILAVSICVGIGNALCITPLVSVVSHWFLIKRGRATGLATIGGSVGGIVVPLMLRSLYPKLGFAWAIRVLAFFCLGCMLFAIFLAKERVLRGPSNSSNEHDNKMKKLIAQGKNFLDFRSLKDMKYSFLIAAVFTCELSLMLMITYYSTYAIAQGMSESSSYLLLTIFNACGILGRYIPGHSSDLWGHFNVMVLMMIGIDLSIFLLWLPFGSNIGVLYAFAAIAGFFTSSILSLTPVCLGRITPVHEFGQKYGLLYFFVSIADLFGVPLGAAIIGNGSKHNYDMFALLCGILTVIGTFCWIASRYRIVGFKLNVKV